MPSPGAPCSAGFIRSGNLSPNTFATWGLLWLGHLPQSYSAVLRWASQPSLPREQPAVAGAGNILSRPGTADAVVDPAAAQSMMGNAAITALAPSSSTPT